MGHIHLVGEGKDTGRCGGVSPIPHEARDMHIEV